MLNVGVFLLCEGLFKTVTSGFPPDLPQRPGRMTSHYRLRVFQKRLRQSRDRLRSLEIPQRDSDVSEQSPSLGPENGTSFKTTPELLFGQGQERNQIGTVLPFPWPESFLRTRSRLFIVGTDILANVTAEDMIADQGAHIPGNAPLELDGQIRDTPSAVQEIGPDQRPGRTCLDAQVAPSAPITDRPVILQFKAQEKLSQEEPGPPAGMDDGGILSDPADPSQRAKIPLQHRSSIYICPPLD